MTAEPDPSARKDEEPGPDSLSPHIASERSPQRSVSGGVLHAAFAGGIGGLIAGLFGGIPYFVQFRGEVMPWRELGTAFFAFVIGAGAVYSAGARAGVRVVDHVRGERPSNALVGAIVGGALVGPIPGAVGVTYFGSQPYAFMGTVMLALAPFVGASVTSAMIARADRKRAGAPASRMSMLGASIVSSVLFGAIGTVAVFTIDDDVMLEWFRAGARDAAGNLSLGLASVGVTAGAVLGAFIGGHCGVTVALARWFCASKAA